MMRQFGIALLFLLLFVFVRYFVFNSDTLQEWAVLLFLYVIGLQWVVPFLFGSTMHAYITGERLPPKKKYYVLRLLFFMVGVLLCSGAILQGVY